MSPAAKNLSGKARTGRNNPLAVKPFSVSDLHDRLDRAWEPQNEKLPLTWFIRDASQLIRAGRISYLGRGSNGRYELLARRSLPAVDLTPGRHDLAPADQWDGQITEQVTRNGKRVTRVLADMSALRVIIQVWNTSSSSPRLPAGKWEGKTAQKGEWVSAAECRITVNAVVNGQWDREWVVPYEAWDEEDGQGAMRIEVRNVADDTPVKLEVLRIGNIGDPATDKLYASTKSSRRKAQPGLHGAVVKSGRVMLPGDKDPYVRFSEYDKHWNGPGVDFYTFRVRFGKGDAIQAGERDYRAREFNCVHMRFTVAIQADKTAVQPQAQSMRDFINSNKYFVAHLAFDIETVEEYVRFMSHRFIFVFMGHGSSGCISPSHPRMSNGARKDMPEKFFPPDEYKCPTVLPQGFDPKEYGGCGSKTHVYQRVWACRKKHPEDKGQPKAPALYLRWDNLPPGDRPGELRFFWTETRFVNGKAKHSAPKDKSVRKMKGLLPKFLFYCGSCMSITTPDLGWRTVRAGTRYYMGWVYLSRTDWNATFPLDVLKLWLKEYNHGSDPDNVGMDLFERIWLDRQKAGAWQEREPRLMTAGGICRASPANAKQMALYGLYRRSQVPEHVPDVPASSQGGATP